MSSPSESITDIDESGLNRKRERAQSVEPTQPQDLEEQTKETSDTIVSAPKKTKRDEDENTTTSVNTIRKNMKDMTTADKEDDTMTEEQAKNVFGGKSKDEDDWGEFAEEEDEQEQEKVQEEKPKYTFGSTSGFGTKSWAATHQTIPTTTSTKPTFGGFKSSFGFGAFKSTSPATSSTTSTTASSTDSAKPSVPAFGSTSTATGASPFAAAAATSTNALSSSTSTETTSSTTTNTEKETTDTNGGGGFGEGAKLKVPNIKQQKEVKTGEEDEDTIYQTKAKLLVLDQGSGNWKERGVGTFRINMKEDGDTVQTRLVMRTDSVYRLILNLLLFEGMKVFIMQDKFVRFAGFETETKEDGSVDTKLVSFALRLSNSSVAKDVCNQINECIPTKN